MTGQNISTSHIKVARRVFISSFPLNCPQGRCIGDIFKHFVIFEIALLLAIKS